jgi:hypothetical protein
MALLDSEVARLRYELGFALLTVNAEPYIGFVSIFTQIIQPYLSAGASTTATGTIAVSTTPTPVTLTLASGTGFSTLCRVVIDVDDRQEVVTAQLVSGTSLTVLLTKAHSGTYPVTVEGGESIIREILGRIRDVKNELGQTFGTGALKKVDEVEFYGTRDRTLFGNLGQQLMFWRDELASALGMINAWAVKRSAGSRVAVY